jgi:hypothetical protein
MQVYNDCVNPLTDKNKSDRVHHLKECFDKGYKLASMESPDMLMSTKVKIPVEWDVIPTKNFFLVFPNCFIAELYRNVYHLYRLNYDSDYQSVQGDIINGLFFGYCIFYIAQYAFLYENNDIDSLVDKLLKRKEKKKLTETEFVDAVKKGAYKKKAATLKTVFNDIFTISTYLYDQIQLNPVWFDLKSAVVRQIQTCTMFNGYCTYIYPNYTKKKCAPKLPEKIPEKKKKGYFF